MANGQADLPMSFSVFSIGIVQGLNTLQFKLTIEALKTTTCPTKYILISGVYMSL